MVTEEGDSVGTVRARDSASRGQWEDELVAVVRAVSGGLLFGVPLLYTMELWWVGEHTDAPQMLLILALLAVVLIVLNLTAGFRSTQDVRLRDAAADSVKALAIGIVVSATVLWMLRVVTVETSAFSAMGKIVNESVPFCLGIGVARFLLSGRPGLSDEKDEGGASASGSGTRPLNASVAELGATVLGAAFVGLSIAPTDEIPMLTSSMDPPWLVVVVVTSLVASYAIVFVAGFARQGDRHEQEGIFQTPGVETIVTYLASLVVAAFLLWLFQRDVWPASNLLDQMIVLGFPATIGGAAGRLAL
ncbi:MAG: TIGR02587 family membrane protein [Ilumatobacter sp.]|uniref:TIGR02587 family membrane protein n=1 Tax=Ilumatobacter sp. TaxID=1967498 RepID=UPI003296E200